MMNYWLELIEAEEAYQRLMDETKTKSATGRRFIRMTTSSKHIVNYPAAKDGGGFLPNQQPTQSRSYTKTIGSNVFLDKNV